MIKTEIINKSPLRILEKSINGGVGKGNIGVIASRKGMGKTACLVHIATDQLFQGKHVIHISFSANAKHIISWYEDIFNEIARRNNLAGAMDVHNDIIKNRIIMNFNQDEISIEKIRKNISIFMDNNKFSVDTIVVDGYNFSKASQDDLKSFKKFACENNLELWFSASLKENISTAGGDKIPKELSPFINDISILIALESQNALINFTLVKDHDKIPNTNLNLKLDPQILLIAEGN
jgi:hypothetical protein